MKIVIAGGSGQVGTILSRAFVGAGHDVVILSRQPSSDSAVRVVRWDGRTTKGWSHELERAAAIINLAGRSVNCRYGSANRREILQSRVDSVRAVRSAIEQAKQPPRVWLQAATATIYAHRFDAPNDESTGVIGGNEPNAPQTWRFSIDVAKAWEAAATESSLPNTRTIIMRSAMIMSPDHGGVFSMLLALVRLGLGGRAGNGRQFVSWVHEFDFVRAVQFLIENDDTAGVINICSPEPVPNDQFMRELRNAWGIRFGLPATKWMLEIGAFLMRTETELILKSRRVVPGRLLRHGFKFQFPRWEAAANELCVRYRKIAQERN